MREDLGRGATDAVEGAREGVRSGGTHRLAELGGALSAGGPHRTGPRPRAPARPCRRRWKTVEDGGHLSATEIHSRVRASRERADLAAVHRTVDRLTALGLAHPVAGGEVRHGLGGAGQTRAVLLTCRSRSGCSDGLQAGQM